MSPPLRSRAIRVYLKIKHHNAQNPTTTQHSFNPTIGSPGKRITKPKILQPTSAAWRPAARCKLRSSRSFNEPLTRLAALKGWLTLFLGVSWKRLEEVLGLLRRSWYLLGWTSLGSCSWLLPNWSADICYARISPNRDAGECRDPLRRLQPRVPGQALSFQQHR
jgi:hypothetical protein